MAAKKDNPMPIEEEKKKSSPLKWVMLVILLLLLGGGGFAAYWFLLGPGAQPSEEVGEDGQPGERLEAIAPEIVTLSPFIVNLADPLGRRFLRMTMDVEVINREAVNDLDKLGSRVRDAIILLLSSKAFTDLASMESKIILKNEIVERLNQIVGAGRVTNVYFTEFVIQ